MKPFTAAALAFALATTAAGAQAATFDLNLSGQIADFGTGSTDFGGLHFEQFSLFLSSTDFPITVEEGDTVNTTVTFDGLVNIPMSQVRTDLVQYLGGSAFPSVDTWVDGDYTFYHAGALVATYHFGSTTSGGLATFTPLFPPFNGPFSFDSFTDNFVITNLSTPGTIERSSFTYSLVSNIAGVPEPQTWTLLIGGFGLTGAMLRRRRTGEALTRV